MGNEARLRDLEYPLLYETATSDLINEFYTPSLNAAVEYNRAVGYFTSGWFAAAASGLAGLAKNGGSAKWVISPHLDEQDWETLKQGTAARRDPELYSNMVALVDDLETGLEEDTKNTLAWMIADGLINIKVAVTEGELTGDFHDKWGIFADKNGDKVAFHGSQNDSQKSLSNYEANSIFTSWRSDVEKKRVSQHQSRFDAVWENSKQGIQSFNLPDSVYLGIANLRTDDRPYQDPGESPKLTSSYRWRHQEEAVEAFLETGNGILDMATGTGKTRTSLKIVDRLLRKDEIQNLVVATYGNDLLGQWRDTLLDRFSSDEMFLYQYYGGDNDLGDFLWAESDRLDVLLTSYSNLTEAIQGDTKGKLNQSLLISDEVHNMGADTKRDELGGELHVFPFRLGLSATPFDPYNEERNEFLKREIGPVVYEFGLEAAIERGILCEFNYTPLEYQLSDEDKARQKEVFRKFRGLKSHNPTVSQSQLYIMLSRVRKESEEKLPIFEEKLAEDPSILEKCIIFVESKDYGLKVQKRIYDYVDSFHTYYGEDDESKLDDFSEGELTTLVTSRAISEGIDIQSVKNIILFTAPRSQGTTTQRIGRALRKNPTNPSKTANIVDFVVSDDIRKDKVDSEKQEDEETTPPDKERYEWLSKLSKVNQVEET